MAKEAYLSCKGGAATPDHSEYELSNYHAANICAVHNADLRDNFLVVKDESKPVYFFGALDYSDECAWKIDAHIRGAKSAGKVRIIQVLSSDCDAQLTQCIDTVEKCCKDTAKIILRKNNCSYYAGNVSKESGDIRQIAFADALEFIAKEISWEDLAGRSKILLHKMEEQAQRKSDLKDLSLQLERMTGEMATENDRLINLLANLEHQLRDGILAWKGKSAELNNLTAEFNKIPLWVRRICGCTEQKPKTEE